MRRETVAGGDGAGGVFAPQRQDGGGGGARQDDVCTIRFALLLLFCLLALFVTRKGGVYGILLTENPSG